MSQALVEVAALEDRRLQATCLRGLRSSFQGPTAVELSEPARASVKTLSLSPDAAVRSQALPLITLLGLETTAERRARLAQAAREVSDVRLSVEARLAAVAQLADDDDPDRRGHAAGRLARPARRRCAMRSSARSSAAAIASPRCSTPWTTNTVPASFLSAVQRATLLDAREPEIRRRAAALLKSHQRGEGRASSSRT